MDDKEKQRHEKEQQRKPSAEINEIRVHYERDGRLEEFFAMYPEDRSSKPPSTGR